MNIEQNQMQQHIAHIEQRITAACNKSGRSREAIQWMAVTKYVSPATLQHCFELGIRHIGENRWQDAKVKVEQYGDRGIWHFIGHLQSNKAKDVVGRFNVIHSLDRTSLARALQLQAEKLDIMVNVFVQINISGEVSKHGVSAEQVRNLLTEVQACDRLKIVGLMTMAPHAADPEQARPVFSGLRQLRDQLIDEACLKSDATELSMGMSNDFEVAVEEGATMLRLGSILFQGPRELS